ncbi:MAG TPA: S9 family peptidase [Terracidiphilus sp.]|jgi:dipeptidyl aminopeptidase/acylaminoacyl peptidase
MFLTRLRKSLRAGLIAGAALVLGSVFNLSYTQAQESHAVPAPDSQATKAPDRAHIDEVLKGLNRGRGVGQVAVSPDGKRLAWVQYGKDATEIRVAPLGDLEKSGRVTAAAKPDQHCHEGEIAWAPDAKVLAFFSDCARPGEQTDLYFARVDGSAARRLTELKGAVEAPAFSPDGKSVAFLYVEGATRPAGALAAIKPPSGVIGEDGLEIQRVAVVTVPPNWNGEDSSAPASNRPLASEGRNILPLFGFLTPANLHVYEFDWRPDSKGLAYVAADPPGENNWWVAKLYTQELGGAGWSTANAILAPAEVAGALHGLQIAVPRWSPDGKAIAFIGGLMSDQGSTGGDVWIVSANGGQPVDLTPRRPTSPAWIEWGDDEHIFVSELASGNSQLVRFRLQGDRTSESVATSFGSPVFSIPGSVGDGRLELSLSSPADHSLFVFRASTFDHATEVYEAKPGTVMTAGLEGVMQLTHLNDGVEQGWGKSVSLSWKSDGFRVQGWLMLPKEYDPRKKYPLIVEVHGGPAAAVVAHWGGGGGLGEAAFSALGYFVLLPNPRGSYGQGEEFTQANRKDFGYGDLADILAGVDAVLAKYPVDPNRVGLTGWSYGGFMSMFAVTQTQRFKAAVAGAGISDWQSYYGENSIDQWMIPYFGASVYDDPKVYARSSAINFIKQARTPTLVVVGDRDGECPAPQSYEFWHALKDQHVPTQLVVYPNEGHGFVDPAHRRDVMYRAVEWFAEYLGAGN